MNKSLWLNGFLKNIERNNQLKFSKKGFLSYILNEEPEIELMEIKEISENGLTFFVDKREKIYSSFKKDKKKSSFGIYFPLTKEKYIIKGFLLKIENKNKKEECWKNLEQEEKLYFTRQAPNLKKTLIPQSEEYNEQKIEKIANNFGIFILDVIFVELIKFKMPQVIADARNPVFESEFKKYKKVKKFIFEKKEGEWKNYEVNP